MQEMKRSLCITYVVIAVFVICCLGQEMSIRRDIGDALKGATKTFLVYCKGSCTDIKAVIEFDTGDPDLFATEHQPPQIGWKEL